MSDVDVPIHLTQDLLDRGTRNDCGNCPIALAFAVACPGASSITVTKTHLVFSASGRCYQIRVPWVACNFIDAFDDGFAVTPRTLTIPILREIASLPGFLADETLLAPLELEPMPL